MKNNNRNRILSMNPDIPYDVSKPQLPLTFRFVADITLDKPLPEDHIIAVDGSMELCSSQNVITKKFNVDFDEYSVEKLDDSGTRFRVVWKNPDYETFPEMERLTKRALAAGNIYLNSDLKDVIFVQPTYGDELRATVSVQSVDYLDIIAPYNDFEDYHLIEDGKILRSKYDEAMFSMTEYLNKTGALNQANFDWLNDGNDDFYKRVPMEGDIELTNEYSDFIKE